MNKSVNVNNRLIFFTHRNDIKPCSFANLNSTLNRVEMEDSDMFSIVRLVYPNYNGTNVYAVVKTSAIWHLGPTLHVS